MITVERAKRESRARDERRARVVLRIGSRSWRLTPSEAMTLSSNLYNAVIDELFPPVYYKGKK